MTLYIKNMVCHRCILSVEELLNQQGLIPKSVTLGVVTLEKPLLDLQLSILRERLNALGFELLDDQKSQMIEQVKTALIEKVQTGELPEDFSIVSFLGHTLKRDYSAISKLFSEVEGITIEHFFILQKIEKVKEWLIYNEFTLSEIAFKLGYSSVAYLSNQFKKVTGMTPSAFKKNSGGRRIALDKVHNQ
ncbi:MAG: helix-turn-helix transcriptional regulator [Lewinellaceae bacterium]|nr:helix-turn-helix transcriptional regulator [Saprospiraceae bacterium]MCB9345757.1 helix-turn-helix transcriptional regulator [Lewinellaceae bacterium]